ncbi:MAG TPA: Holliday junction branch migration protein RuvA [Chloroflexota bacterium]|nr:Holliday junction branch migration protein RuvA [Chloroflexota bacterium]
MITAVRGALEAVGPDWAVVGVGGLSLRVFAPTTTLSTLPAIGQVVHLHTYFQVREDVLALYGFQSPDDLALFEQLIGVSGVGPKLALAMLSSAPSEILRTAIASEKAENLTKIPGIGRKLAGRLILELRGKIVSPEGGTRTVEPTPDADVTEALVGLGYSPADALAAVRSLGTTPPTDLEERIRQALRYFART